MQVGGAGAYLSTGIPPWLGLLGFATASILIIAWLNLRSVLHVSCRSVHAFCTLTPTADCIPNKTSRFPAHMIQGLMPMATSVLACHWLLPCQVIYHN